MAGNSRRKGAIRKPGSKKGATVGSGGQRRKGLEPKGPTPRAEERTGHPASRRARSQPSAAGTGAATRDRPESEIVAGRNPVVEALRAAVPARELLVMEFVDADERIAEAVALAGEQGLTVRELPKRDLDRRALDAHHQGIVLLASPFEYTDADELITASLAAASAPVLVALDGVTDPHNLGAVARSALAFGAHGLLLPARRSAKVTAVAWRSSAGAFARLPVALTPNLTRALAGAQEAGFFVLGLAGEGAQDLEDAAAHFADVPVVLVVGSEGEGLSRLVAEQTDAKVGIPMPGGMESLNASVAAGVALYTLSRARDTAPAGAGERSDSSRQ